MDYKKKYIQLRNISNNFLINKIDKTKFVEKFCEITGEPNPALKEPFDRTKWQKKYNRKNKEEIKAYNKKYNEKKRKYKNHDNKTK